MELADNCHIVTLGTADNLVLAVTALVSTCLRFNKLFLYLYNTRSYAGDSVATGRDTQAGQVKG